MADKRRYPRVQCDHAGHIVVRYRGSDHAYHRKLVDVQINSVAPGGAGLAFSDDDIASLDRGTAITLRFNPTDCADLEIPARVAWSRQGAIGVDFQLELAPHDTRRDYARWIVDQLVESGHSPSPRRRRPSTQG